MTEIPEDIAKVAGTLTVEIIESAPGIMALINTEELIGRAILAEREAQRERDAKIAEAFLNERYVEFGERVNDADAGEMTAAAIRKG